MSFVLVAILFWYCGNVVCSCGNSVCFRDNVVCVLVTILFVLVEISFFLFYWNEVFSCGNIVCSWGNVAWLFLWKRCMIVLAEMLIDLVTMLFVFFLKMLFVLPKTLFVIMEMLIVLVTMFVLVAILFILVANYLFMWPFVCSCGRLFVLIAVFVVCLSVFFDCLFYCPFNLFLIAVEYSQLVVIAIVYAFIKWFISTSLICFSVIVYGKREIVIKFKFYLDILY